VQAQESRPIEAAEARIRELTSELKTSPGEGSVLYHAQLGATVLAHLYNGNLAAWRKGAKRDSSVRRLASQLSDTLPQTTLYRSLAIYEVLLRHAARFPGVRTMGVRALAAIARAPAGEQDALIEAALAGRWSGTRIEGEVRELPKRSKVGRPRKSEISKALGRLTATLAELEAAPLDELDETTLRQCADDAFELAEAFDRALARLEGAASKK
jgi:hypothetical protein